MKKVKVKNITDDLVVERLGYYFQPGEEKTIEIVHSNHMMVLAACRNLSIKEVEAEKSMDISQMNMDEVLDAVTKGEIHLEKAIELEEQGKRRNTLLKKLHDMKKE